jgi:hypothetical protein
MACIKVEGACTKKINKLEIKTPLIKEPLTKEYFRDVLDLPKTVINFKCMKTTINTLQLQIVMLSGVCARVKTLVGICKVLILS